jgi:hypothetical protein
MLSEHALKKRSENPFPISLSLPYLPIVIGVRQYPIAALPGRHLVSLASVSAL